MGRGTPTGSASDANVLYGQPALRSQSFGRGTPVAEPLVSVIVEVSIPGQVVEVDVSSSFHQVPDAELEGLIEFWEVDELVQLIKDSQPSQQVLEMLDHPAQNELNFVLSGSSVEAYLRKHRPHLA